MKFACFSFRLLIVIGVAEAMLSLAWAAPPKPLKVLIVCGGCCHDYNTQKELLSKGMMERAHVDVEVVHQGGTATNSRIPLYEKKDWYKGFDIVIHDECFSDVKDNAYTQNIITPHREGLPAVVLHCAMHCYRAGNDEWFKFCGITSPGHGAHYAYTCKLVGKHPVLAGLPLEWEVPKEELYYSDKVWSTATPLGEAMSTDRNAMQTCIWTNQYGKTRVFDRLLRYDLGLRRTHAMQTIGIVANCITKEKQGINLLAYVQWQIADFSIAYRKLDVETVVKTFKK